MHRKRRRVRIARAAMPPTTPPTIAPVLDEEAWVLPLLAPWVICVPGARTVVLSITVVKTWPLLVPTDVVDAMEVEGVVKVVDEGVVVVGVVVGVVVVGVVVVGVVVVGVVVVGVVVVGVVVGGVVVGGVVVGGVVVGVVVSVDVDVSDDEEDKEIVEEEEDEEAP
jgi:hypothetical protein